MKIIFAGTPEVAVDSLRALAQSQHEVVAVLTRVDAPMGRKRVITPSPVAQVAESLGIPLIKSNKLNADVTDQLASFDADLGVVVAFGGILPREVLGLPRHGWINLHFSQLPAWRGAAPIQWELISGSEVAHTTIFNLVEELDAGDVYSTQSIQIEAEENAGALLDRLAGIGAVQLLHVVNDIASGLAKATAQTGSVTLARKLNIDDARLDFRETAEQLFNRFRGVTPEPGAWILVGGLRVKVLMMTAPPEATVLAPGSIQVKDKQVWLGTSSSAIRLEKVQPAGKSPMTAADWFRGLKSSEEVSADA